MSKLSALHESLSGGISSRIVSHVRKINGKPATSGLTFSFYDSMSVIPEGLWDAYNHRGDIFLSSAYLAALERSSPANMKFKYAVVSGNGKVSGILYFQIIELNPLLLRRPFEVPNRGKSTIGRHVHDEFVGRMSLNILVCGNILLSGEHGFSIAGIPEDAAMNAVAETAYILRNSSSCNVSVTLIKDFYGKNGAYAGTLENLGYGMFDAGPNMTVHVRKNWATFEDYLDDMKPKYRKRAVGALKKGKSAERRTLTSEEIGTYCKDIYDLYCQVAGRAKFRPFVLPPGFFMEMKSALGDRFVFDAYFHDGRMIGFTTRILNGETVEGYVHGLDYAEKNEYELYQNFLLEDMRTAIGNRALRVNTGRTSVAMKSSIGAVPEEMRCYIGFSGRHMNILLKPFLGFFKPRTEYCRNPFG
jgi:hypothetical protein